MAGPAPDVKQNDEAGAPALSWRDEVVQWCENHGRLGWYLACFGVTNIFLNLADLLLHLL